MTRDPRTATISLPPSMLREIDRVAESEGRTRSELIREALRQYLRRMERWEEIFAYGEQVAAARGFDEREVSRVVQRRRRSRSRG